MRDGAAAPRPVTFFTALATELAAPCTASLTVSVTPAAVPETVETSARIAFMLLREALAESMATLALTATAGICLTAGSSSSTMPSSLATMGCACAMTSFAEAETSSIFLRAERTVRATSTTAQTATTTSTIRAMFR